MEISPITGIRVLPAAKAQSAEAGLTAYFYIDPTARSGDDRYTGGGKKAAGAEDEKSGDQQAYANEHKQTDLKAARWGAHIASRLKKCRTVGSVA